MLLAVVGQGWRGGHIQPAVTVQVGQDHISVVGGGQETLVSRDIGSHGVVGGAINQDAVDGVAFSNSFVHEEDVGVAPRTGEGLLPHTHQVDVAIKVNITPGVILFLGVVHGDRGIISGNTHANSGFVCEVDPVLCHRAGGQSWNGEQDTRHANSPLGVSTGVMLSILPKQTKSRPNPGSRRRRCHPDLLGIPRKHPKRRARGPNQGR